MPTNRALAGKRREGPGESYIRRTTRGSKEERVDACSIKRVNKTSEGRGAARHDRVSGRGDQRGSKETSNNPGSLKRGGGGRVRGGVGGTRKPRHTKSQFERGWAHP